MTFIHFMSVLIGIGGALSTFFFRKGGVYNPVPESEPVTPPEAPASPVEAPSTPEPISGSKPPTLAQFCTAIRDFEGLPGDANYKNNNPGNVRFQYSGYLPIYEPVKCSPKGFAIFKDYATGWLYLTNMIRGMFHNHPTWTILDFFTNYAPSSENPTRSYAQFVAKRLGVDISYKVKDIVVG